MSGVTDSWAAVETAETTPAAAPETAEPDSAGRGAMAALAGTRLGGGLYNLGHGDILGQHVDCAG